MIRIQGITVNPDSPSGAARIVEAYGAVPNGAGDRFTGYAVIGLPFRSGHVLALRRFVASSSGPAYTSVWHRNPEGKWAFYSDVEKDQGCGRYLSNGIESEVQARIQLRWPGEDRLIVTVEGVQSLRWEMRLRETAMARAMNASGEWMPESWWQKRGVLRAMGKVASTALGTGAMNLTGLTPNGHEFIANPRRVWMVVDSTAESGGQSFGETGPLAEQASLGDFLIPQRGVFALVDAYLLGTHHQRRVA